MWQKKNNFFFIIGTGRCGTTLMAQVLNAHSKICVPSELQIIFETSHNGARLAEIFESRQNLIYRAEDYIKLVQTRCPHRLEAYYDYAAFFHRLIYPVLSLRWLLTALYTDIARSQGKTMFAEQTPWYGQNIALLNRLFPKAKFIHMVRDGRDVALSFARTPWWHKDPHQNLERWAQEISTIKNDGAQWLQKRMLTVRYEDLVLRPEAITKEICAFLAVPFEKDMLDAEKHIDYGQFSYHTSKEVSSAAYQRWQKKKKNVFFSDSIFNWKRSDVKFESFSPLTKEMLELFDYTV